MGEAKYRKNTDPNFGKVPKDAAFRGLVVSPPIEIEGTTLKAKSSSLDPQELRFSLLLWDRLAWPASRAMHFASNEDELFLEREGVLSRPEYTFYGDGAQSIAQSQMQAFKDLTTAQPGMWALAQGENSLLLKDGVADEGSGLLLELHRAIPIPKYDVPLAEILEFKSRRRDELLLLRYQIETFMSAIEAAPDKDIALKKHLAEIDEACANLLIVSKEWQFPIYLSNLKASFNLAASRILLTGGAFTLGKPYGLTAACAAAGLIGALSTLDIKADIGLRSIKVPKNPYRYAHRIQKELN